MSTFQPGSESNDLDRLLENGSWVRRLAVRLLRDENLADDVLQEVWITAIQRPPSKPEALRAWLSVVARSLCLRAKRTILRRKRIECAARSSGQAPAADEIEARLEGQQRLLAAVLSLSEPYRTVVYLHFYDGLKLVEIARLSGTTDSTVRTQLARGLEKLRERLERDSGGRDAARSMLLALVVPAWLFSPAHAAAAAVGPHTPAPRRPSPRPRPPWTGAAASTGAAISLAVLIPLLLWNASRGETRARVEAGPAPHRPVGVQATESPKVVVEAKVNVEAAPRLRDVPAVRVVVVDSADGRPVPGARVYRAPRTDPQSTLLGETSDDGILELNDSVALRDPWIVLADGFVEQREAAARRDVEGAEHVIALEREHTARVAVVKEDGSPAAGVAITILASVRGVGAAEPFSAVTDLQGEAAYVFRHPDTTIRVESPGRVSLSLPAETPRMIIRLRPGLAVDGVVVGPDGAPVPSCGVRLESTSLRSPTSTTSDEDGRFSLGVLDPDEEVSVRLRAPGFPSRRFTGRPPGAGPWRFALADGITISGVVTRPDGAGVAGGHAFILVPEGADDAGPEGPTSEVRGAGCSPPSRATRRPVTRARADIGADGRFALGPISPGDAATYLFVNHPDYARHIELLKDFDRDPSLTIRLERGSELRGSVAKPDGTPLSGALLHFGEAWSNGVECVIGRVRTSADGAFTFRGLPSGLGAPLAGAWKDDGEEVVRTSIFVAAFAPDLLIERDDADVASSAEVSPGAFEVSGAIARGDGIRLVGAARDHLAALDVRLRNHDGLPVRTWTRAVVLDPDGGVQLGLVGGNLHGARFFSDQCLAVERVRGADLILLTEIYRWRALGGLDLREGGTIEAALEERSAEPWRLRLLRADGSPAPGRQVFVGLPFGAADARAAVLLGSTNDGGEIATTALPRGLHLFAVLSGTAKMMDSVLSREELADPVAWSWAYVEDGGSVEIRTPD